MYVLFAGTYLLGLAKLGYYLATGLEYVKEDEVALWVHQVFPTRGLALHLSHLLQITLQSISTQVKLLESKQKISTGKNIIPLLILVLIWRTAFLLY